MAPKMTAEKAKIASTGAKQLKAESPSESRMDKKGGPKEGSPAEERQDAREAKAPAGRGGGPKPFGTQTGTVLTKPSSKRK